MAPSIDTVWENTSYEPQGGKPYQQVFMLPGIPENPTSGGYTREIGVMQISLFYPLDKGSGDADARAKAIKNWFPRAASYTVGGITTIINRTPYIMPGSRDGDRWMVPIRIPYYADIP